MPLALLALACADAPLGVRASADEPPTLSSGPVGTTPAATPPTHDTAAPTPTPPVEPTTTDTATAPPATSGEAAPQWFCAEPGATMAFDPPEPAVGAAVDVSVTAPVGYVYIGMNATPPTGWTQTSYAVTGSGPFTWTFGYTLDAPGRYDFTFSADSGSLLVCAGSIWVE